jgi:hypothetical protein
MEWLFITAILVSREVAGQIYYSITVYSPAKEAMWREELWQMTGSEEWRCRGAADPITN